MSTGYSTDKTIPVPAPTPDEVADVPAVPDPRDLTGRTAPVDPPAPDVTDPPVESVGSVDTVDVPPDSVVEADPEPHKNRKRH